MKKFISILGSTGSVGLNTLKIINRKKIGFPVDLSKIFNKSSKKNFYDQWMEFNLKKFI